MLKFLYSLIPFWLRLILFRLRPRHILDMRQRASQWRAVRAEHMLKEPACAACGRSGNLEVHHIIPVSISPALECDLHNLITLCGSPCHITFGHFMNYHCYNKDVRKMTAEYYKAMQRRKCK